MLRVENFRTILSKLYRSIAKRPVFLTLLTFFFLLVITRTALYYIATCSFPFLLMQRHLLAGKKKLRRTQLKEKRRWELDAGKDYVMSHGVYAQAVLHNHIYHGASNFRLMLVCSMWVSREQSYQE